VFRPDQPFHALTITARSLLYRVTTMGRLCYGWHYLFAGFRFGSYRFTFHKS
jgi:hypothetical protein